MNDKPVITRRMKWIVKQLKEHPGAVITHKRDAFMEKSYYFLEWGEGKDYQAFEVTNEMKKKLAAAKMIEVVTERPIYRRGVFVTTERDYGLPSAS